MKEKILLLFFFTSSVFYCQNNNLDSLKIHLINLEQKINTLNAEKEKVKNQISIAEYKNKSVENPNNSEHGVKAIILYSDTNMYEKPDIKSNIITTLPFKDSVLVLDRYEKTNLLKIKYKDVYGYITYNSFIKSDNLLAVYDRTKANRLDFLTDKFGRENAFGILNKKYWIGMSENMALESLGKPEEINRSSGSWGIHEQWVYKMINNKNLYLYFENRILKSFQN